MSARSVAQEFFACLQSGDAGKVSGLLAPGATVALVPLGVTGTMADEGAAYLQALAEAFPDLMVRIRRLFVTADNAAVAEVTLDGTQAADFLGAVNQEKHFDLDQAWILQIDDQDRITAVTGYWCQNQAYRRLGVKRLDKVSITAR